ncbi:SDR family NAD(P)-dependent oxidoreductase [Aestuariirhabdus sp. Z084]|uniref:SDR family NAD(P)-dependent oxidoreductase n=1 Tax=Aestuariirhabdus haliotis TaxID=2918751 RepID=UPI00201B4448|nr:SDR family NAD(P)-dependent oxidoreductase [Aestuariirhabdus haliotis]MCL6416041.1 SDR family NAD(P)-dependent oxidoreductase [Aestuariirhabdus haliotis]MCL6419391.1 SDR family NAD(P)-dependent oxidoreductase [Aestuariirhabdus haliotis]
MTTAITGKTILITGASSGIGRELAIRLARAGNYIIALGRNTDRLQRLQQVDPARLTPLVIDLGAEDAAETLKQALRSMTDQLDIVLLSAGCCEYVDDSHWDPALFRRVMNGNFFTAVNTISACLPLLKAASGRSQIVGLSSLSTSVGFPRAEAYGSSKAALHYLLDSLRVDASQWGIDVTVVSPGFIRTPMTAGNDFPMPFMMESQQAAEKIIQGISQRKRHIAFPFRLWFPLWLAAKLPLIWYRWLGPKLTRVNDI